MSLSVLKEVARRFKLDDDLIKENNRILDDFLTTFIDEMKRSDGIFRTVYQRLYYTGSSYCGLRIKTPDEFDVNVVLKLPFEHRVDLSESAASYATCHIHNVLYNHEIKSKWLDGNNYLILDNVRSWMQSVVDKAWESYSIPSGLSKVIRSSSGPARKFQLLKRNGGKIDIDLVPVFPCSLLQLEGFLVPKPFKTPVGAFSSIELSRLWQTDFPNEEKELIHDIGCAKPVIKLLKLLRDQERWNLTSYHLKTVVMWMLKENRNQRVWSEDMLVERFEQALKNLRQYIINNNFPYFFVPRYNLMGNMDGQEKLQIVNKIAEILHGVKHNPAHYYRVLFNV